MNELSDELLETEKTQAIVQVSPITREALQRYGFPEEQVNQLSDADLEHIRHKVEVCFQESLITEIAYDVAALLEYRGRRSDKDSPVQR